jgi:hypothetical protein
VTAEARKFAADLPATLFSTLLYSTLLYQKRRSQWVRLSENLLTGTLPWKIYCRVPTGVCQIEWIRVDGRPRRCHRPTDVDGKNGFDIESIDYSNIPSSIGNLTDMRALQ